MTATNAELELGLGTLLNEVQSRRIVLRGTADPSAGAGVAAPRGVEYDRLNVGGDVISSWKKMTPANTGWAEIGTGGGGGGGGGTAADTTFDDSTTPITAANVQVALEETLKRTGIFGTWDMTPALQDAEPAAGGHLEATVAAVSADVFNVSPVNGVSAAKVVRSQAAVPVTNTTTGWSRFQRVAAGGDLGAVFFGYVNQEATMADVAASLGGSFAGTVTALSIVIHDLVGFLGPAGNFVQMHGNGTPNAPNALGSFAASSDMYLSSWDGGFLTCNLASDPGVDDVSLAQVSSAGVSGWRLVYGLYCLNASPSVPQAPISIDFGDSTNAKQPTQVERPALPSGAAESLRFFVTTGGYYEGKGADAGSVAEFYNGTDEIIVIPAQVLTEAQVTAIADGAAAAALAAADLDKGLPILDWTTGSVSTESLYPSEHWRFNATIDAPYPINNMQLIATNPGATLNGVYYSAVGGSYPTWRYESTGTVSAQYVTIKWIDTIDAGVAFANGGADQNDVFFPTLAANGTATEVLIVGVDTPTGGVSANLYRGGVLVETIAVAAGGSVVNDDVVSVGLSAAAGVISLRVKIAGNAEQVFATQMRSPDDGIRPWICMLSSASLTEQMFFRIGVDAGGTLGSPFTHFTGQYSNVPVNLNDPGYRYRVAFPAPGYVGHDKIRRGDIVECVYQSPGTAPWSLQSRLYTITRAKQVKTVAREVFDAQAASLQMAIDIDLALLASINAVNYSPVTTAAAHGFGYVYLVAGGTPVGTFSGFPQGSLAVSNGIDWVNIAASEVRGRLLTLVDINLGEANNYYQPRIRFVGVGSTSSAFVFDGTFLVDNATETQLKALGWQMENTPASGMVSAIDVDATGGGTFTLKLARAAVHRVTINNNTQLDFDYESVADGGVVEALVCVKNATSVFQVITPAGTVKIQAGNEVWILACGRNNGTGGDPFNTAVFVAPAVGLVDSITATEGGSANIVKGTPLFVLNVTSALTAYGLVMPKDAMPNMRFTLIVKGGGSVATFTLSDMWAAQPATPAWPAALASGDVMEFLRIGPDDWARIR